MAILIALIVLPVIEIALFIQVGQWIGLWPTVALAILSTVAGLSIMRTQGQNALRELRQASGTLSNPALPVANGALILLGGALLAVPGFLTDLFGLLLLIPPLRRLLLASFGRRITVETYASGPLGTPRSTYREPHRPGIIIDGEFEELGPDERPPHGKSGWTQH